MSTNSTDNLDLNPASIRLMKLMTRAEENTSSTTVEQDDHVIEDADILISDLDSAIIEAKQLQARRARAGNALLPINTLPPELLIRIWTAAAYDFAKVQKDGVWILARVSSLWTDTVLASSELWCVISSRFPLTRTQLALAKSAGRPLSIMLGTEINVMETFNILLPESQRWRELWLVFGLPEISQTLKVISLPMLETLEMVLNYGVGDPASLERPNLQTCPSLRFFSIISVPLDWSSSLPVPGGLRHLAIEMVKHGPTPSQMLALLSSTVQLEALLMNYVGPPPGHDWGSAEEQKPVIMPYLRKIRLIRMDPIFVKQLISHIHAESCSVIALQCIAPSSYRDIKLLQSKLARIAASLEKIFVIIDDHESQGIVHISSFDTTDQTRLFAASQSTETPGFSLTFLTGPHSIRIEAAMDFLAYTQIPISMTLQCSLRANRWALRNIDWDRLPSLCELTIAPHVGIFSIMYPLCAPRGPRKALRWVCPKLTVLRFHKLGFLHPAFPWYLRLRWGPPESNDDDDDENDGMKRDPSRPTQLTLCEVPLQNISKFLSPEEMKHFAAEWKDSTPIAAVDSRSPGQMEGQKLLPAGEDAVAEVSNP